MKLRELLDAHRRAHDGFVALEEERRDLNARSDAASDALEDSARALGARVDAIAAALPPLAGGRAHEVENLMRLGAWRAAADLFARVAAGGGERAAGIAAELHAAGRRGPRRAAPERDAEASRRYGGVSSLWGRGPESLEAGRARRAAEREAERDAEAASLARAYAEGMDALEEQVRALEREAERDAEAASLARAHAEEVDAIEERVRAEEREAGDPFARFGPGPAAPIAGGAPLPDEAEAHKAASAAKTPRINLHRQGRGGQHSARCMECGYRWPDAPEAAAGAFPVAPAIAAAHADECPALRERRIVDPRTLPDRPCAACGRDLLRTEAGGALCFGCRIATPAPIAGGAPLPDEAEAHAAASAAGAPRTANEEHAAYVERCRERDAREVAEALARAEAAGTADVPGESGLTMRQSIERMGVRDAAQALRAGRAAARNARREAERDAQLAAERAARNAAQDDEARLERMLAAKAGADAAEARRYPEGARPRGVPIAGGAPAADPGAEYVNPHADPRVEVMDVGEARRRLLAQDRPMAADSVERCGAAVPGRRGASTRGRRGWAWRCRMRAARVYLVAVRVDGGILAGVRGPSYLPRCARHDYSETRLLRIEGAAPAAAAAIGGGAPRIEARCPGCGRVAGPAGRIPGDVAGGFEYGEECAECVDALRERMREDEARAARDAAQDAEARLERMARRDAEGAERIREAARRGREATSAQAAAAIRPPRPDGRRCAEPRCNALCVCGSGLCYSHYWETPADELRSTAAERRAARAAPAPSEAEAHREYAARPMGVGILGVAHVAVEDLSYVNKVGVPIASFGYECSCRGAAGHRRTREAAVAAAKAHLAEAHAGAGAAAR